MLNWINRFIARTSRFAAPFVLALAAAAIATPARADSGFTALYAGRSIRFTHVSSEAGEAAIGVSDPGFATLLRDSGAFLTWKPGERYVLITTSVPVVVSFAIGDRRYDVGPIALQAGVAPFLIGDEAYLPLREVLHSLDLALRQDGAVAILQPQLDQLDVRQEGNRVTLFAHGGTTLHARIVQQNENSITYAFDGVGTTLAASRQAGVGGVRSIAIENSGTIRQPVTLVTVTLAPGATAEAPQNTNGRDVLLAFDGSSQGSSAQAPIAAPPTSQPVQQGQAPAGTALVTGVTVAQSADGIAVTIAINGDASYQWHRLRAPDNRFWIDVENAQLQGPPFEQNEASPLVSMRVRQDDPTTVRVALSLNGPKDITVTPSPTGLGITIGFQDVSDEPRSGNGSVGSVVAAGQSGPAVTPAPSDEAAESAGGSFDQSAWKFGPRNNYAAANPRLIVIDPGHGGSDVGTMHGGVSEASLTLDMAKRLRDLLVQRGWEVKMTRETDVDVYAPNDSARDELQARDNIANKAGARLFISIHVNGFMNAGPYGTTCYISKPEDLALARSVERQLANDGTKDDGIVKSHLYVTLHAKMPAVLVETAFLTNPNDYALLTSETWRQKVAQEMADGIAEYAQEYPAPNDPPQ